MTHNKPFFIKKNRLLGQKILPTGIGHTTHCFCTVQGTKGNPYLTVDDGGVHSNNKQQCNLENIEQIASALSPKQASKDSKTLVSVYWNTEKCKLLKHDIVMVDTPGK